MDAPASPKAPWLWLVRQWRGELSLGQSYWLSGLLLWCVATSLGLGIHLLPDRMLRVSATCRLLLVGLIVSGAVWRGVGTWRSATRGIAARTLQGRRTVWAHVARTWVVVGFVTLAAIIPLILAPIAWTDLQLAAGFDTLGPHTVTLRNHAREIDIDGMIGLGTTNQVRNVLASAPTVRTVDLDSRGGLVIEARVLRDLIESHGLATYVGTHCASACTIAFLGGEPRILRRGAKLGFHRYFISGLFHNLIAAEDIHAKAEFAERGVPADFVAHVFATPGKSLWLPGDDELLSAFVVTKLTDGLEYSAAVGGWLTTQAGASAALLGSPAFAALQRRAPDLFAQAVSEAMMTAQQDATLGQALARAQGPLLTGFRRYVRVADDRLQLDIVRMTGDEGRYLGHGYPSECSALFGRSQNLAAGSYFDVLPPDLRQRDVMATGAVIDAGATRPNTTMASQTELVAVLKELRLAAAFQSGAADNDTASIANPFCRNMVRLMDALAALAPDRLGPLMRRLYTGSG